MCGAYGWIRLTAVSAAKRASGAVGSSDSSFTSTITAEIGVWNWMRRSMSSVTLAIVSCARCVSGPSPPSDGAASATSCTMRHSRRRKRTTPSIPFLGPLLVLVGRAP